MKRSYFIAIISMIIFILVGCSSNKTKGFEFSTDDYKARLEEAISSTNDANITLKEVVINTEDEIKKEDKPTLATYFFTDSTGILYKEDEISLVINEFDIISLGDSVYNLLRIFVGTVDNTLSMGERQKVINELSFSTDKANETVVKMATTENYKFTYICNNETNNKIIKAEKK